MNNGDLPINSSTYLNPDSGNVESTSGLTKREYFAAMAMQSIIPSYISKPFSLDDIDSPQRLASQWAIKFADELLKQLEQ